VPATRSRTCSGRDRRARRLHTLVRWRGPTSHGTEVRCNPPEQLIEATSNHICLELEPLGLPWTQLN
jgi:hypothetical protein